MLKNGQHALSWILHSVTIAYVFASAGNSSSYPSGSSRTDFLTDLTAGAEFVKMSFSNFRCQRLHVAG